METSAANLEQQVTEPLPERSEAKQMLSVLRPPALNLQSLGAWEAEKTWAAGDGVLGRRVLVGFYDAAGNHSTLGT